MIVTSACRNLEICGDDFLLDLCCGNGALTTYFYSRCRGGVGVDFLRIPYRRGKAPLSRSVKRNPMSVRMWLSLPGRKPWQHSSAKGRLLRCIPIAAKPGGHGIACPFEEPVCGCPATVYRQSSGQGPVEGVLREPALYAWNRGPCRFTDRDMENCRGIFATRRGSRLGTCSISRMPTAFYGAGYRFDALFTPA